MTSFAKAITSMSQPVNIGILVAKEAEKVQRNAEVDLYSIGEDGPVEHILSSQLADAVIRRCRIVEKDFAEKVKDFPNTELIASNDYSVSCFCRGFQHVSDVIDRYSRVSHTAFCKFEEKPQRQIKVQGKLVDNPNRFGSRGK